MFLHLLCHSREFEDVESLIVHGGPLVDVDDHTGFTSTTEKALQVVGQLAFPERNMLKQPKAGNRQPNRLLGIDIRYVHSEVFVLLLS